VPLVAAGCGGDSVSAYCDEVQARQKHLSEVVAGGKKDALITALPDFRALAAKAPEDIGDSWTTLIDAVAALQKAVASGDQAQITSAATAFADIQQQVRDVCHTPLTL